MAVEDTKQLGPLPTDITKPDQWRSYPAMTNEQQLARRADILRSLDAIRRLAEQGEVSGIAIVYTRTNFMPEYQRSYGPQASTGIYTGLGWVQATMDLEAVEAMRAYMKRVQEAAKSTQPPQPAEPGSNGDASGG